MATPVYHFTSIEHLETTALHGLVADVRARRDGLLRVEVGLPDIKRRRRERAVPIPPYGVVGDYVPFYFAPRSPMMYSIFQGNVPEYTGGTESLIYLVSSVETLLEQGAVVTTDRNAVLGTARFVAAGDGLNHVDLPLMRARYWFNTTEEPDRRERRMAECLVHHGVPWEAIDRIVTRNEARKRQTEAVLREFNLSTPVSVSPDWYF